MFEHLAFWKEQGMNPRIIYDIGANCGSWSDMILKIFPTAHVELFEANAEHKKSIEKYNHHITLLGNEYKEGIPFYRNTIGCTTGNSIYLEQTQYFTPNTCIIDFLTMHTLDDYVVKNNLRKPEFVKLDVQGAELDILKGMTSLFDTVKYFVIEVSLHKYNKDSPMIEDIIKFLHANEYSIIDIVDLHRINGFLAQVDLLFAHTSTKMRREHFYNILF